MTKRIPGAAALLAALLLAAPACKHPTIKSADTIEEVPKLSSVVRMGDPSLAKQLISGFYGIEANSWRWTAREFAVELRPPTTSKQKGCVVELHLTIPGPNIETLGSQTLSGTVGNLELPPRTYSKPGAYVYSAYLTPNLLVTDTVRVNFHLDKAIPPGDADKRELGVVVSNVRLVPR